MLLAILFALAVAFALTFFAKAVLVREPLHSPETNPPNNTAFASGVSSAQQDTDSLRKRNQPSDSADSESPQSNTEQDSQPKSVMQPPVADLEPPKDVPFTLEELKAFDGSDPSKPIYVAIKGLVFDVSRKTDVYGKGKSYNLFAGKDASRALGKSSLKQEDAVSDYSTLDDADMKTLDDWHAFFLKRYNVVGKVSDLPPMSQPLPAQSLTSNASL